MTVPILTPRQTSLNPATLEALRASTAGGWQPPAVPWAVKQKTSYPVRAGNRVAILIDGAAAYAAIAQSFRAAKQFLYTTISFGAPDFRLERGSKDTFFSLLRDQAQAGVDVKAVIWKSGPTSTDTIPDPSAIPSVYPVNQPGGKCIQARWDEAPGYSDWYRTPVANKEPFWVAFPAALGCHHQKTYIMDDGQGGVVAYVGGINPVQAYWDTPDHEVLDAGRVADVTSPAATLSGLQRVPPLHDIFYRLTGPAVADVLANFIERYNGASERAMGNAVNTAVAIVPAAAAQIPALPDGVEVQVLRTIAPGKYNSTPDGEQSIREVYFNLLQQAGQGSIVYIEDQYFFDRGILSQIQAAATRGAKVIIVIESAPDEGTLLGAVEQGLEQAMKWLDIFPLIQGHANVTLLTLGNASPDPRPGGSYIYSETYIHSKTMAVWNDLKAGFTGGSANIAFTSMWFHSEMNLVFADRSLILDGVSRLWQEHLNLDAATVNGLLQQPENAFNTFVRHAQANLKAKNAGQSPDGRVYPWSPETALGQPSLAGVPPSAIIAP
ncbi:MAG TPA: phosphatidylserine/phosphatidylglycerophosphate/cardiolipin synthase family protein [Verrucomicrobiae bacterium]